MSMRLSRSIVGEAEAEAVRRVIVEDGYLGMGHETCLFEQELAAYLGVAPEQVVTTNTGTAALTLAGLLYLIGVGGDSYYGLVSQVPILEPCYDGLFFLSSYTRNGLFVVPLFVLLGAADVRLSRRAAGTGFLLSMAAMTAEGLLLHNLGVQRHDSMYLALPLCICPLIRS